MYFIVIFAVLFKHTYVHLLQINETILWSSMFFFPGTVTQIHMLYEFSSGHAIEPDDSVIDLSNSCKWFWKKEWER